MNVRYGFIVAIDERKAQARTVQKQEEHGVMLGNRIGASGVGLPEYRPPGFGYYFSKRERHLLHGVGKGLKRSFLVQPSWRIIEWGRASLGAQLQDALVQMTEGFIVTLRLSDARTLAVDLGSRGLPDEIDDSTILLFTMYAQSTPGSRNRLARLEPMPCL